MQPVATARGLAPADIYQIARQEVRRAVRRRPHWERYYDDLVQDAAVAILLALRHDAHCYGKYARIWARGEVMRAAFAYFHVNPRTKRAPQVVDESEAWGLGAPDRSFEAYEAEETCRDLLRRTEAEYGERAARVVERTVDGATMRDIAAELGVKHQAVDYWLKRTRPALREWYGGVT